MNILDLQDKLKNFSQDQLIREMQMPTGQLPQFLLLNEITRRKKMQDSFAQQQDQAQQQTTVVQDAINAAGMPQGEAQQLAGTMAPQTDMAGNTGAAPQQMMPQAPQPVQGMAGGGIVALQEGGRITSPRLVVRDGRQMLEMPDGSIVSLSRSQQAMLDRELDPTPPRTVTGAAEMDMPSIGDVPAMAVPQIDQAPAGTQPDRLLAGLPGARPASVSPVTFTDVAGMDAPSIGDVPTVGLDAALMAPRQAPGMVPQVAADAGPSVTQSRLSPTREMMKAGALDPRLDMVPGSVLFKQQQQEVDDFNRRVAEQTAYETARDTAPLSNDPYTFDAFGNIVTDPDELARLQYAQEQGLPYPGDMPPPYEIPSGGLDRVAKGLREVQVIDETSGPGKNLDPITGDSLLPEPPVADTPPVVDTATPPSPPGGIAAAARGAGAPSDFEQELMTMLAAREKRATQDKFLALAQAGMALMSSTQPTFGGALGEAGAAGLGALREGQRGAEADRLALLGQIEQSRMGREKLDLERQALAARSAASGDRRIPVGIITPLMEQLNDARAQLSQLPPPPEPGFFGGVKQDPYRIERARLQATVDQLTDTVNAAGAQYGVSLAGTGAGATRVPLN